MNGRESQYLCRVNGQDLIVRRRNPEYDDIICLKTSQEWPKF